MVPHFHQAPYVRYRRDFATPDLYVSTLTLVLTRLVLRLSNGETMTLLPSTEYMVLATNLVDALGDTTTGKRLVPTMGLESDVKASDTVLLQLQALFGPMLTSALQLVDKREGKLSGADLSSLRKLITSRPSFPSSRKIRLSGSYSLFRIQGR